MKRISTLFIALTLMLFGVTSAFAHSGGPLDNLAGNPPDNNNCTLCHSTFPVNSGSGTLSLTGLPANYTPGNTYTISVNLADPVAARWGFEVTSLDAGNNQAGAFVVTDPVNTQLSDNTGSSADFLKHTSTGTYVGSASSASWSFDWTAPASGDVTFYFAGNAANSNGFTTGDYIYTSTESSSAQTFPSFNVSLTYVSGSPVPAGGGNLTFDVYLLNASGQAQDFDAWLASEYEGGAPTTLVLRSFTNYQAGWAINRPGMFFPVSGAWAGGNYEFFARCGNEPNTVWAEDGFPFVKSGTGLAEFVPTVPENVPEIFGEPEPTVHAVVHDFALRGNYPNPFNPTTTISYSLTTHDYVALTVYDLSGRLIATLVDGYRDAGHHDVSFDASGLASGMYLYRLNSHGQTQSGKMMLLK
ncbi:T9SS type A sorting domain-containing protein [bacterium]|nr:T9SS type A sorting domain-containing protein [bacterium]